MRDFSGDGLLSWCRQNEYTYTAANLDPEDRDVLGRESSFVFFRLWLVKCVHR